MKSVKGNAPLTRRRKKMEEESEKEAKRRLTQFIPGNVIGLNDILVDECSGKIKIEAAIKTENEESHIDIKEEANIRSFDGEPDYAVVVVKDEIDLSVEFKYPAGNCVDENLLSCVTETVTDDFDSFEIRKVEDGITNFETENSFMDFAQNSEKLDVSVANDVRSDAECYRVIENELNPISSPVKANFEIKTREFLALNCCKISKHNKKQKQPAESKEALRLENQLLRKENEALQLTIKSLENKLLQFSKRVEKEDPNIKIPSDLISVSDPINQPNILIDSLDEYNTKDYNHEPMENVPTFGNSELALQNINSPAIHLNETVSCEKQTDTDIVVFDQRLIFFFPEVVQIIWKKYGSKFMSNLDFLNARRVCTTWGIGIYNIDQGPCSSLRKKRVVNLTISTYQKLNESLQDLQNQGILLKTDLTISISNPVSLLVNEMEECITAINDFLTDYGHCIQKFTFDIEKCNRLDCYSTFVRWLTLMPYLEEVSAYMNNSFSSYFMANKSSYDESEFPELKCLKHFSASNWPAVLLAWALRANRSIDTLNLQKIYDNLSKETIEEVQMPQIKELTIEMKSKKHSLFLSRLGADELDTLRLTLSDFDSFRIISKSRKYVLSIKLNGNSAYQKQIQPLISKLQFKDLQELEIQEVHDCKSKYCRFVKRFQFVSPYMYFRAEIVDKLSEHVPKLCKVAIVPCHNAKDKTYVFIRKSTIKN